MVDRCDRVDAHEAEQNQQVSGPVDFSTAFIHACSAYWTDMLRLQVSARNDGSAVPQAWGDGATAARASYGGVVHRGNFRLSTAEYSE